MEKNKIAGIILLCVLFINLSIGFLSGLITGNPTSGLVNLAGQIILLVVAIWAGVRLIKS